jgi:hypothetical protein
MEMKIISARQGFIADHSSTSYQFYALDKPLDKEAKAEVASLSRRAVPTGRSVYFIYHAEGYDLPGGWERLMEKYYDLMYSESYDWWLLAMAFPADEELQCKLFGYEFNNCDDLGISIYTSGKRTVVAISCRLDYGYAPELEYDPDDYDEADPYLGDDTLLGLLTAIRELLIQGDFTPLDAIWRKYGKEAGDPPLAFNKVPPGKTALQFEEILDSI